MTVWIIVVEKTIFTMLHLEDIFIYLFIYYFWLHWKIIYLYKYFN